MKLTLYDPDPSSIIFFVDAQSTKSNTRSGYDVMRWIGTDGMVLGHRRHKGDHEEALKLHIPQELRPLVTLDLWPLLLLLLLDGSYHRPFVLNWLKVISQ